MNQLKQYWEAVKPRDNDTHYLIERSLTGPPGDWWQIIKDEVNNFQTFLNKFSRGFCDEQVQHELRRKLEFGCHQVGKMGSRSEYDIRLYAEAKELRATISPVEIIQKRTRYFNEEIKYAIIGRRISHIGGLVDTNKQTNIQTKKKQGRRKHIMKLIIIIGEVDPRNRLHEDQHQEEISKMERSVFGHRTHHRGRETPAMEIEWREAQDKTQVETLY